MQDGGKNKKMTFCCQYKFVELKLPIALYQQFLKTN
jgi:hypothetical protein